MPLLYRCATWNFTSVSHALDLNAFDTIDVLQGAAESSINTCSEPLVPGGIIGRFRFELMIHEYT